MLQIHNFKITTVNGEIEYSGVNSYSILSLGEGVFYFEAISNLDEINKNCITKQFWIPLSQIEHVECTLERTFATKKEMNEFIQANPSVVKS